MLRSRVKQVASHWARVPETWFLMLLPSYFPSTLRIHEKEGNNSGMENLDLIQDSRFSLKFNWKLIVLFGFLLSTVTWKEVYHYRKISHTNRYLEFVPSVVSWTIKYHACQISWDAMFLTTLHTCCLRLFNFVDFFDNQWNQGWLVWRSWTTNIITRMWKH